MNGFHAPLTPGSRPALFLDRDGVVNREVGYLSRPDEVEWVDGLWPLCRLAADAGWAIVIVTNQSGIARGYYSEADFHALMTWMAAEFTRQGAPLTAYYYCPHHPEQGVGEWKHDCDCRKPAPGMLLRAAAEHGLDLRRSVMVGDRCGDVGAANSAGLLQMFLIGGTESGICPGSYVTVRLLDEVSGALRAMIDGATGQVS